MLKKFTFMQRLMAALFVFTLVAAACGDDEPAAPDTSAADAAALAEAESAAAAAESEAAAAQAEADAAAAEAAAAAAEAEEAAAALAAAEAEGAASADELAALQAELAAAQEAEAEAAAAAEAADEAAAAAEAEAAAAAAEAEEAAAAADAAMMAAEAPESITIAILEGPGRIDPHYQDGEMRRTMENVYERLLERDLVNPAIFVPRLAASLPRLVDETTWELKLRRGINFHNGAPFNAAAAKYSIERIIHGEIDSDLREQVEKITGVDVVDDYTIRINTDGPDPVLPARLYMVQMVEPGAAADGLEDEAVGTGPYKFVEWIAGDSLTLTRNTDYWGPEPQIDDVTFVFLPDEQSRVTAVQAGDVDLAVGLSADSAGEMPKLFVRDEGIEYPYLRLKNYEGPLGDYPELRVAIAHALNVDDYVEFIYEGQAGRAHCHIFGSGVFGHNPNINDRPYDPDLARQIIADSGYQGEEISFLANGTRWTKFDELSEAIAADMAAVGLNIDFQLLAWEVWLFDEFLKPIGEVGGDIFLSSSSNELQDGARLGSYIGRDNVTSSYDDPVLVGMLEAAASELDEPTREAQYHEIMKYNCDNVGILPLLTYLSVNGGAENLSWIPRYDDTARVEDMTLS
ncbi:MAG: ABC transporter substrate-binding protein [Acidimicrobiaceae bacterium]|nr:ABC transporter substrate-binding protein [Acidimicrobiaceae bacterium]MDE0515497.1 ABC transporter substrate-binding protein [Acidimicrobiaceae bacterium]